MAIFGYVWSSFDGVCCVVEHLNRYMLHFHASEITDLYFRPLCYVALHVTSDKIEYKR